MSRAVPDRGRERPSPRLTWGVGAALLIFAIVWGGWLASPGGAVEGTPPAPDGRPTSGFGPEGYLGPFAATYFIDWDPRLCQRFTELVPASVQPGQWYWRLIRARWYDEGEPPFSGQHHIFVDTLNGAGARQVGVPIRFSWSGGSQTVLTEAKPGEPYAANFPMYAVAPAYSAQPADGAPADLVAGMGLGNVQHPDWKIHTSYLLVWQWTQATGDAPPAVCGPGASTPTPSPTPSPSPTSTPTRTPTPSPTARPTPVAADDFNDNALNAAFWTPAVFGSGPSIAETNQRLEIRHPADAAGDPFGAEAVSVCQLAGDFDIQVDYLLTAWPSANGIRVGLVVNPSDSKVVRVSFASGDGIPGYPNEVYLTHFADGVRGVTGTGDASGTLRLVRLGGLLTGYYLGAEGWVTLHTGPVTGDDVRVALRSWGHSQVFKHVEVRVAFDNFRIHRGEVICPFRPVYLPLTLRRVP